MDSKISMCLFIFFRAKSFFCKKKMQIWKGDNSSGALNLSFKLVPILIKFHVNLVPIKKEHFQKRNGRTMIVVDNKCLPRYYQMQNVCPDQEWSEFIEAMRKGLPSVFRNLLVLACLDLNFSFGISVWQIKDKKTK